MLPDLYRHRVLELDVLLVIVIPPAGAKIFGDERGKGHVPNQALLEGEIKGGALSTDRWPHAVHILGVLPIMEILRVERVNRSRRDQPCLSDGVIRRRKIVDVRPF